MIKYELKESVKWREEITEIECDKCGIHLGSNLDSIGVGWFIPCFSDESSHEHMDNTQIVMCDKCWEEFYDDLAIDRRPLDKEKY